MTIAAKHQVSVIVRDNPGELKFDANAQKGQSAACIGIGDLNCRSVNVLDARRFVV